MTPSVRVRLRREGLREAMKRQVRERLSRGSALDEPGPGEEARPEAEAAARGATASILTKS